jgi:hypothetical protein
VRRERRTRVWRRRLIMGKEGRGKDDFCVMSMYGGREGRKLFRNEKWGGGEEREEGEKREREREIKHISIANSI